MEAPSSAAAMPEPPLARELGPPEVGVGFAPRTGARIIDTVILTVAASKMSFGYMLVMQATGMRSPYTGPPNQAVVFLAGLASSVVFGALCEAVAGCTPGKLLLGLRVISQSGKRASFGAAALRNIAFWVDGLFFGIVGYSSMQRSGDRKQRYGDQWAKTMVVPRAAFDARVNVTIGAMFLAIAGATAAKLAIDFFALFL